MHLSGNVLRLWVNRRIPGRIAKKNTGKKTLVESPGRSLNEESGGFPSDIPEKTPGDNPL